MQAVHVHGIVQGAEMIKTRSSGFCAAQQLAI